MDQSDAKQLELDQLNKQFSFHKSDSQLSLIAGKGGIPLIEVFNRYASAIISLQGAHILSWAPNGKDGVIWLSEDAKLERGKSVRGGVPVCWPWFGAYEAGRAGFTASQKENEFPAHGFARTTRWEIISTESLPNGNTRISFTTSPSAETAHMWPKDTTVQYIITIGDKLELELITHNNGSEAITIGQAFHTYFSVGDISDVIVHGLNEADYLDKPDGFKRKQQHGAILIEGEVDRIYLDTTSTCIIDDSSLKRSIIINKFGSHSTVVWNPWQEVAEKMGDLGKDGYRKMLCIETANAAEDVVSIDPGKAHQLWAQYEVQNK